MSHLSFDSIQHIGSYISHPHDQADFFMGNKQLYKYYRKHFRKQRINKLILKLELLRKQCIDRLSEISFNIYFGRILTQIPFPSFYQITELKNTEEDAQHIIQLLYSELDAPSPL